MRIPLWTRWRTDRELDEEIEAHVELEFRANLERGLAPNEARAAALRRFGNRAYLKETVRQADPFARIKTFASDALYGVRNLRHSKSFTLVAAISLALGIGANTLIFSLLNATLLKPLGFPDPERLVAVWTVPSQDRDQRQTSSVSTYFGIRDQSQSFERVGAFNGAACGVRSLGADQDGAPAERIRGQCFTPSLFQALGVEPLLGRVFTDSEDQVDYVAPVALISYRMWQRRFGGDRRIIGKTFTLNRVATTVIGVLPADFNYFGDDIEFFVPLEQTRTQVQSRLGGLTIVGRLKAGVSAAQAQADMDAIAARLAAADPERHRGLGARVESLQRATARHVTGQSAAVLTEDYGSSLLILQGAVAFVLLIACANVAGLLLARTAGRRGEVALRLALGACRSRIMRQLVNESLPLGILGGTLGILLAWLGLGLFVASAPPDFPRLAQVSLDLRVLGFTAAVILATSVLSAIVPAVQASKVNLADPLKEFGRATARPRLRSVLVTGQIALALVLLIGAGLMIHSFVRVVEKDLGADPKNLLAFDFRLPLAEVVKPFGRYRGVGLWDINPATDLVFERVYERLQTVPGVLSAAGVNMSPLSGEALAMPFMIEGRPLAPSGDAAAGPPGDAQQTANYFAVTTGFFGVMRIPLLRGRDFDSHDIAGAPLVLIVNQTMARQFFPNEDPLGKRVRLDFVPDERPREIIGVVGDTAIAPLQSRPEPSVYVPHRQQTSRFTGPWSYYRTGMSFVIRTSGEPMSVLPSVKRAVAEVDRNTPVADAKPVNQTLDSQTRNLRVHMLLLGIFGTVALALAATGVYGVVAYSVAARRREIGIRMALGARAGDVLTMVFRQSARVVGIGLLLGLAGAFAFTRVIHSALFEVTPTDPATYAGALLVLLLISAAACLIPARRAAAVDPTVALKHE